MIASKMTEVIDFQENEFRDDNYVDKLIAISEDIVIENILEQIEDSLNIESMHEKQSLFKYFDVRIRELLDKYTVETNEYAEVVEKVNETLEVISREIEETYGLSIEYSEVIDIETKFEYVRELYNFFTINIYDNLLTFTTKFIQQNIDMYVKELGNLNKEEKENLSYKYIQNDIDNKYTPVVYHTKDIINTLDFPPDIYGEDIIDMMIQDDIGETTSDIISRIFLDNEWVDVTYEEPLSTILVDSIRHNDTLIKDLKIILIETYKDIEDSE